MKKKRKFSFFGYNPPTSGEYGINGYTYRYAENFCSVKRCKEYKNVGFDTLQLRYEYAYTGEEPWESSKTKYMWDIAYEAGIKKLLLTDLRIDGLIRSKTRPAGSLIGEGKLFQSEAELDAQILKYVSDYKDKPGFYGLQLLDEPWPKDVQAYCEVARSLRRVLPNIYLQVNLFTMCVSYEGIDDRATAWEKYASEMLDLGGLENISFDDYPFRREYIISGNNIRNYQILARLCKKRGVELQTVLQSFSYSTEGILRARRITESDMYWQTNVALGFGCKTFAFYTYMPKRDFDYKNGGDGIDGACFINQDGTRSALYTYTKRIIKEMQKFSKIVLKYEYENSYIVTEKGKTKEDFEWTEYAEECGACPFPIQIDKGVALITELKNGEDVLFMIENIGNVKDELFDNVSPMKMECVLPEGERTFYFRGEKTDCDEKDGRYFRNLKVGDAIFIEIKNKLYLEEKINEKIN